MFAKSGLAHLLLPASLVLATPTPAKYGGFPQKGIKWSHCNDPKLNAGPLPVTCGPVTVPLDYTDPKSNETLDIELVRIKHSKEPFKGSIFVNYGGPGGSGAEEHIGGGGATILNITGGQYDVIGWDARGTGKTLYFDCFDDVASKTRNDDWMVEAANSSDTSLGRIWGTAGVLSQTCHEAQKKHGSLIGTVFTARDLMRFVDALDEGGMLHYYGLSYGTILGQTAASLFPDRMGRLILDGNVNPYQWWNYHDVMEYADTDKTWRGLLAACVDHPKNCPLSHQGSTADEIEAKVDKWLDHLKYHPMEYNGTLIDWSFVRGTILGGLYVPASYPKTTGIINDLMNGDASAIQRAPASDIAAVGERRYGIGCGDRSNRGPQDAYEAAGQVMKLSKIAGDTAVPFIFGCARWQFAAKERFDGHVKQHTKNPILLIGNTHDPVTPLQSSEKMNSAIPGSVLLTQDGFGHSSLQQRSECTIKTIQKYLLKGEMPEKGKVCQVDKDRELFADL